MANISTDFSTWSGTAASNQPDSGDTATVQADLQAIQAALRTVFPAVNGAVLPTHTELNYVDGVTSAIQTQLDSKATLAGGTFTGDIVMNASSIITAEGADVVAATTTNIWATDGNTRHITGNTTITSFGTAPQAGARMRLIFDGTPSLTHSANLNLNNGSSDILIQAGDYADVYADTTTQFDVVVTRKSGAAIASSANTITQLNTSVAVTDTGTDGKITHTVDGVIISEETDVSRVSTIDGGTALIPEFKCRAWARFNGTGTPALIAGGNISSSITDNGTGDYTLTFSTAMPDANYVLVATARASGSGSVTAIVCEQSFDTAPSTTAFRLIVKQGATFFDSSSIHVAVFR